MALLPLLAATQQRAAAALLGAIIGDAASQTSHWNYDRRTCSVSRALPPPSVHAKLRNDDRYDNPEFYPCNGFYTVLPGGNSCYGDQLIAVAEHLVRCRGVDGEDDPLGRPILASSSTGSSRPSAARRPTVRGPRTLTHRGPECR